MKVQVKKGKTVWRDGRAFHAGDVLFVPDEEFPTLSSHLFIVDDGGKADKQESKPKAKKKADKKPAAAKKKGKK